MYTAPIEATLPPGTLLRPDFRKVVYDAPIEATFLPGTLLRVPYGGFIAWATDPPMGCVAINVGELILILGSVPAPADSDHLRAYDLLFLVRGRLLTKAPYLMFPMEVVR